MRWGIALAGALAIVASANAGRADERAACADAYVAAQVKQGQHKLLAARDSLRTCARHECAGVMRGQIIKDCAGWLAQVEAAIPSVVLWAKTPMGDDRTDVTVSVDDVVVATKLDGRAIDVDPGAHVFTFEAPGARKVTVSAVVVEGTRDQRIEAVLPSSEPAASGAAPAASPVASAASPSGAPQNAPADAGGATQDHAGPSPSESGGPGVWPYVAFGVGAAGLAVGTIFGVLALSTKSTLGNECTGNACMMNGSSQGDIDALHVQSWVSNVGFGVAAAGAVTGVALMLFAPRHPVASSSSSALTVRPWLGVGAVGITGGFL